MIIPQIITPFCELSPDERFEILCVAYEKRDAWKALFLFLFRTRPLSSELLLRAECEQDVVERYICGGEL